MIDGRLLATAGLTSATHRASAPGRPRQALTPGWVVSLLFACFALMPRLAGAGGVGDVFERVAPSVVVVQTTERDIAETGERRTVSITGLGSGVLMSLDGKVLTAAHLVQAALEIRVEFAGGERVAARVIASEPDADVALLHLERAPTNAVVARLGDSDRARIGEEVFIVGAPYGISHTLTVGHIGGRHKPGQVWDRFTLAEFLQTDAAINQGNSGGPMFNMAGEVIGIVSHIISKSGGFEGLGFVVTSNVARQLLLERRSPWWGFDGVLLTGDLARVFNLAAPGLLVQRVVDGSPAAQLGLRGGFLKAKVGERTLTVGGDVILGVQGMRCDQTHRVQDALAELKPGDRFTITVLREGQVHELAMVLP